MTRLQLTKWFAVGVACAALAGCAPPFAQIDGILVQTRPALPEEFGRLQVIRTGQTQDGAPGMSIEKGDTIVTAADGVAVLTLRAGWQVIFEPGTVANIENPSIFVKIGKLIIKKLQEVTEALTVNSEFASAGVEGTEFVFEVTPQHAVQISVLEGRVVVRSRQARWEAITYVAGEAGAIRAGLPPAPKMLLDSAAVRNIRQHALEVERLVRPIVPRVTGLRAPAARDSLTTAGLRIESVVKVITRRVPAGTVVAIGPSGGTRLRPGDRVVLQVEDSSLVVPRVVGLPLLQAIDELRRAGFAAPDTTAVAAPNARIGNVLAVSPGSGAVVSASTRIRLTVASTIRVLRPDIGRMPIRLCKVPNLRDRTEEVARSMLSRTNLQVGNVNHLQYGKLVTGQNPGADAVVSCGSRVDFDIGTNIGE